MTENSVNGTEPSREARQWAMICHLSALAGLLGNGIGFVLGPLIVWLIKKEDHPFVDEQGKEAVNFQLTMLLAVVVCCVLFFLVIPLVLAFVIGLLMIVFSIVGAIKANDGVHYTYPFSIPFIK
jgi:uncharacterized Tic20 family protein